MDEPLRLEPWKMGRRRNTVMQRVVRQLGYPSPFAFSPLAFAVVRVVMTTFSFSHTPSAGPSAVMSWVLVFSVPAIVDGFRRGVLWLPGQHPAHADFAGGRGRLPKTRCSMCGYDLRAHARPLPRVRHRRRHLRVRRPASPAPPTDLLGTSFAHRYRAASFNGLRLSRPPLRAICRTRPCRGAAFANEGVVMEPTTPAATSARAIVASFDDRIAAEAVHAARKGRLLARPHRLRPPRGRGGAAG